MHRLLIPFLAAVTLPTAVNANVDPQVNEMCLKATDYKGCVELNTKKSTLPKCNFFRKDNCFGEKIYNDGKYEGELSNGIPNGYGNLTSDNGFKYVGQWVNGKMNGYGKATSPEGVYEGGFKDNNFHGEGALKSIDGWNYVGGFKDNLEHGRGIYTWPNGNKYIGQLLNGKITGQGTIYYASGDRYSGDFLDGKRTGQGTFYWADGSSWAGEFLNGKRIEIEGNSCPRGYAYSGNGDCRQVTCVMGQLHHFDLGGKDHACGNAPFWSGYIGGMTLEWDNKTVRAEYDPKCPAKPPEIGWRSSCTQALGSDVIPLYVGGVIPKKKNKKPLACRNSTLNPNHPKCKK